LVEAKRQSTGNFKIVKALEKEQNRYDKVTKERENIRHLKGKIKRIILYIDFN